MANPYSGNAPPLAQPAQNATGPIIRRIGLSDLHDALRRGWEDFKAGVVLVVLLCTAVPFLLGRGDLVPHRLQDITLALVLFYFGSR